MTGGTGPARRLGGRQATTAQISGDFAISVGNPEKPLPDGWRWRLLADLARLESGHTPSRRHDEYWGGDIPWIGIKDATGNHGRVIFQTNEYTNVLGIENSAARVLPKNTVCLSRTASVGYVVVMGRPMATSQDFVNWSCGPELDYRFLKYALLAEGEALLRFASGSVHPTIYFPEVKAFYIATPPLAEQQAIAGVLSCLDDKIELNRQVNETLEAMAQAIFKDWFVDFGPVRRKQEGATDPVAILGGLLHDPARAAETAALFPDAFGDGGLPQGWAPGKLGDLAKSVGTVVQPTDVSPDTPYIGLEHMPRKSIALAEWGHAVSVTSGKATFKRGQILFGKLRPYFHKVGIAPIDGVASTDIAVMDAQRLQDRAIVTSIASSEAFIAYTDLGSDGTKMPRTSWSKMSAYPIVAGSVEIRDAFSTIAQQFYDKVIQSISESRALAETRDYLLPKLISGEVRVREVASLAETTEA